MPRPRFAAWASFRSRTHLAFFGQAMSAVCVELKEGQRTIQLTFAVFEYGLSYRFMIKPDIQPGTYDWPLQLVVATKI